MEQQDRMQNLRERLLDESHHIIDRITDEGMLPAAELRDLAIGAGVLSSAADDLRYASEPDNIVINRATAERWQKAIAVVVSAHEETEPLSDGAFYDLKEGVMDELADKLKGDG